MTVNVVALIIVFVASLIFYDAPFTAVQMLWVNLIMDTFAALALATEAPKDNLMERQPVSRKESIINAVMWRNIVGQAIYQVGMIMVLLFWGRYWFNLPYDEDTPFYADEDFVLANPEYELY